MVYRKIQAGESLLYREIRLECLKKHPESFGSSYETQAALPQLAFEQFIEQQTPGKFIVGAFDQDKLIGIGGFSQETKPKLAHQGTVVQVYVQSGFRGQKIGYHLLLTTLKEAFAIPAIEQIIISVFTTNASAYKLYTHLGFKEFALHKRYLKVNDHYHDLRLMMIERDNWLKNN